MWSFARGLDSYGDEHCVRGLGFMGGVIGQRCQREYWVRGGQFSCPGRGEGGGGAVAAKGKVRRGAWRL